MFLSGDWKGGSDNLTSVEAWKEEGRTENDDFEKEKIRQSPRPEMTRETSSTAPSSSSASPDRAAVEPMDDLLGGP